MSLFDKVPGLYTTREGGLVWVKYVFDHTEYPVIGCRATKRPDGHVEFKTNIMYAYTITGRCLAEREQAEDIVGYDSCRQVLIFFPVTSPPQHSRPILLRSNVSGKLQFLVARYTAGASCPKYFASDDNIRPLEESELIELDAEWASLV